MYILCVYALVFTPWKIKSKAKRTRIQKVNTQKMLLEKVKDSCLMWVYCSVASCFLPNLKFQLSLVFQQDQLVFLIILIHWIIQSKLIQIFFSQVNISQNKKNVILITFTVILCIVEGFFVDSILIEIIDKWCFIWISIYADAAHILYVHESLIGHMFRGI